MAKQERLVAADASPLIGLAAAGRFDLLREIFGTVTVTAAVRDEVMAGGALPGARELKAAIRAGWIKVARAPRDAAMFPELGAGEASTLALAGEHGGDCIVLMDDALGRARARARGITITGLAGVLLAAKRARLISSVRPLLERLTEGGFRVAGSVLQTILEEAGEAEKHAGEPS